MVLLIEGGLGDPPELEVDLHVCVLHIEESYGLLELLLGLVPGFDTLVRTPQVLVHGDLSGAQDGVLTLQVYHVDPVVLP